MPKAKKAESSTTKSTKTTKKTTKAKNTTAKKKSTIAAYEKAMENEIPQWLRYPGNKRKLVPIIMDLIPSPIDRFVDLFGGTGITGLEAFKYGKCSEVIYNDLEYDMSLMLEWLYVTPINDIIDAYNNTKERWFGDLDNLWILEEDTKEWRDRHPDSKEVGAHKKLWQAMVNHYNKTRIIVWDREEDKDIERIIENIEDKELRKQINEFINGVQEIDDELLEPEGEIKVSDATRRSKKLVGRIQANNREKQAREHKAKDGIDIFAARGDFFNPGELLFMMINANKGRQRWGYLGRGRDDMTPALSTEEYPKAGLFRTYESLIPFISALKQTPMRFFSHSFTEGWIEKEHMRPRTEIAQHRWREMLGSLTINDLVFIDPPYIESSAPYNGSYNQRLEIYLLAFCELLTERGIPWMLTDNLYWENDIFKNWMKSYYTYQLDSDEIKLYHGKPQANKQEVIVCNFKPQDNRKIPKSTLKRIDGKVHHGLIKWEANGNRWIERQDKD